MQIGGRRFPDRERSEYSWGSSTLQCSKASAHAGEWVMGTQVLHKRLMITYSDCFSRMCCLGRPLIKDQMDLCPWIWFPLALWPLVWNSVMGKEIMFTYKRETRSLFYYKLSWHTVHRRYTSLLHRLINRKIHRLTKLWHFGYKFKQRFSKENTG